MIIDLSQLEVSAIDALAHFKFRVSRELGLSISKYESKLIANLEAEKIGLAGEWAIAKYLNVPLSFDATINGKSTDGGADLVYNRLTIDVKTTKHITGRIIVPNKNKLIADILFLCYTTLESLHKVNLMGWIPINEFNDLAEYKDFSSYGKRWILENKHLRPAESLAV